MSVFQLLISIATNPAVDAAVSKAAQALVTYIQSLSEQDAAAVLALLEQMRTQSAAQLATADADLASLNASILALTNHAAVQANADAKQIADDITKRFAAPLPKPVVTL